MADSRNFQEKVLSRAIGKSNRTDPQAVYYNLLTELKDPNTKKTHWEAERLKAIALMEMDGLLNRGMLQGERGKVYQVSDLERFILHTAFALAEIKDFQEVILSRLNDPFQRIEHCVLSLIHDSLENGISPKKEAKVLSETLASWREKLLSKAPQTPAPSDHRYVSKTLTIYFSDETDAPASVIARHVKNIMGKLAGTPGDAIPSERTIRHWVLEQRKTEKEQS